MGKAIFSTYALAGYALTLILTVPDVCLCQPAKTEPGQSIPVATQTPPCNDFNIQKSVTNFSSGEYLSPKQRACIYASNLFTPSAIFGSLASAGLSQLRNSNPEFGQGMLGYSKRAGPKYAEGMAKATGEYVSAWVFRENPKPPTSQCSSWHRVFCAAGSLVVKRNSSGELRPVFSKVLGAASDGFVGTEWYADDSWKVAVRRSGVSFATSLVYREFAEFQPEIFRTVGKLFSTKGKSGDGGPSAAPPADKTTGDVK